MDQGPSPGWVAALSCSPGGLSGPRWGNRASWTLVVVMVLRGQKNPSPADAEEGHAHETVRPVDVEG